MDLTFKLFVSSLRGVKLRSERRWVPFNRSEVFVGEREFFGYLSSKDFWSLCILDYSLWIPILQPSTNNNQELFFSELVTQTKDTFFFTMVGRRDPVGIWTPNHVATQPLLLFGGKKCLFPLPRYNNHLSYALPPLKGGFHSLIKLPHG